MSQFILGSNKDPKIHKARRWVYEMFALEDGLTVAEFEELWGWPKYTLYPKAAKAKEEDRGYEMYGKRGKDAG